MTLREETVTEVAVIAGHIAAAQTLADRIRRDMDQLDIMLHPITGRRMDETMMSMRRDLDAIRSELQLRSVQDVAAAIRAGRQPPKTNRFREGRE